MQDIFIILTNGKIFANSINLNGSEFSITGNSSDWELIEPDEIEFVYAMSPTTSLHIISSFIMLSTFVVV